MTLHTTFMRGKRVWVQLKNGEEFIDRWAMDTHRSGATRYAVLKARGKIPLRDIRAISIYREPGG